MREAVEKTQPDVIVIGAAWDPRIRTQADFSTLVLNAIHSHVTKIVLMNTDLPPFNVTTFRERISGGDVLLEPGRELRGGWLVAGHDVAEPLPGSPGSR